jgi:hypothetical protein
MNKRWGGKMDRRRNARVFVQLPVQVWGLDSFGQAFTESAIVTNMSSSGIVLQGLRRRLRTGDTLDVRMGASQASFRIVWIGDIGEVGLQSLTSETFLPKSVLVHCAQAAAIC